MPWHSSNPKALPALLPEFFGGEFIVKRGLGRDTLVFHGKVDRVVVPDDSQRVIVIKTGIVYEQWIGSRANFSPEKRWKEVDLGSGEMPFEYSWYYRQPRHARLKLEFKSKKKSKKILDRCWLCSHTDPIYLELFRTMLMKMFLEESAQKQSLFTKWLSKFKK